MQELATRTAEPGRYGLVLVLALASFVFLAAAPDREWAPFVSVLLQGATLLVALRTSRVRPRAVRFAQVTVGLAVVASAVALTSGSPDSRITSYLVNVLLVSLAPPAIGVGVVRLIRARRAVVYPAVLGALAIYLLLGMFFASVYLAINELTTEQFFVQTANPSPQNFQYFSFVTLTTVGYGDLTSALDFGRTVAVIEMLIGQIYLVTVVATLVSNLQPRAADQLSDGSADIG